MNVRVYAFALCLLVFTGCQKDETDPRPPCEQIFFGVSDTAEAVRGPENTLDNLSSIGIFGYYTATERWDWASVNTPSSLKPDYFTNTELCRNGTSAPYSWRYEGPPRFWSPDTRNKVSFFAYAPYEATVDANGDPIDLESLGKAVIPYPAVPSDTGLPVIRYTVPGMVKDHVDLMYAAQPDMTKNGIDGDPATAADNNTVPLRMKHALTRITFTAQYAFPHEAALFQMQVTGIYIYGIHTKGTLRLDTGEWIFDDNAAKGGVYVFSDELSGMYMDDGTAVYELLNNMDPDPEYNVGALMLIPQPLDDAGIRFEIESWHMITGEMKYSVMDFGLSDIATQWKSGESVNYRVMLKGDFITR